MRLALTQLRSTTGPRKNLALVTDMAHRAAGTRPMLTMACVSCVPGRESGSETTRE